MCFIIVEMYATSATVSEGSMVIGKRADLRFGRSPIMKLQVILKIILQYT